jgi:hypothetical protein
MKKFVTPVVMFLFGVFAFIIIMLTTHKMNLSFENDPHFWFYRVLTALAAAAISISIPGMLKVDYTPKGDEIKTFSDADKNPVKMSLLEKEPTISASGSIAVFVLVYLFNPII